MEKLYEGIDVSKWQGTVDFQKVKKSGMDFVMLRTGFGRFEGQKDPTFERNYQNAKAQNLFVGAYHYSYAKSVEEAKEEAKFCLSILEGKTFEFPIAFDMEERTVASLGKEKVSAIAKAFCEALEDAGYYVVIYANKFWLDNLFTDEIFSRYDIWLAHWVKESNFDKAYGLWQYTSDGQVDGISGRVDLDFAYKNYQKIMQKNGLNGFKAENDTMYAGKEITLSDAPLYATASTGAVSSRKSGTFYLYDGKKINDRYRITNSKNRVEKEPIATNVTGYVRESDVR